MELVFGAIGCAPVVAEHGNKTQQANIKVQQCDNVLQLLCL